MKNLWAFATLGLISTLSSAHNILDYGALDGSTEDTTRAFTNTRAMTQAIIAANNSE